MRINYIVIPLILLMMLTGCQSNIPENELQSPDGKIRVTVNLYESSYPVYNVWYKNQLILQDSKLGLQRDDTDFTQNIQIYSVSSIKKVKDQYTMLHGKKKHFSYLGNQKIFHLKNSDDQKMDIVFQVSNDGVAFRYLFPDVAGEVKTIVDEVSSFQFRAGTQTWIQPMAVAKSGWCQTNPSYEEIYIKDVPVNKVPSVEAGWIFPALFKYEDTWMLISETAPDRNYCGCRLKHEQGSTEFSIDFPPSVETQFNGPVNPQATLPWKTPWRIIAIGDLKTIVESTLGTDLAKPSILKETDFIKPGRSSWSWVFLKDDSTIYPIQKRFIDYASEMGWEYCLVDADWDQKIGYEKLGELSRYAQSKGVGVNAWYNSSGDWNSTVYSPKSKLLTTGARHKEFARLREMGIKGVKVDFFGGDGQSVMTYYQDIFEDAAEYGLAVNCHGCTLPRGWQRTYPNLLTMESVRGLEFITFEQGNADQQPDHCCMLPFTRNVFDPMDFTPVFFSDLSHIKRSTSNAFELALPVLYHSGIQHYGEIPSGMKKVPDYVRQLMKDIPVSWLETRFVDGYPGKYVVMARKGEKGWYVAGINGEREGKELSIDLSFIENSHTGILITDGNDNRSFRKEDVIFQTDKSVLIKIAGYGGFVMQFED